MSEWYLVYCKARQEDVAATGLEEQGYRVYLPKLRVRKRRQGGAVDIDSPLFPRYLFVATSSVEQSIGPVQYTRGVQKMVRFGTYYLPVSSDVVRMLRERADPETGLHHLESPKLEAGDPVRIASGAFAGIEGVFEAKSGKDRVVVLLDILGRTAQVAIPIEELER